MKIDISEHDLKFVLFSLKAQYNYWNELKEKKITTVIISIIFGIKHIQRKQFTISF